MESRMADPLDRVEQWLNHVAEVGTASMLPERAFPSLLVGYTVWRGKSKYKLQYLVIRIFMVLIFRRSLSSDGAARRSASMATTS